MTEQPSAQSDEARSGFDPGEGSASAEKDKDNQIDLDTNVSKPAPGDGTAGQDEDAAQQPGQPAGPEQSPPA